MALKRIPVPTPIRLVTVDERVEPTVVAGCIVRVRPTATVDEEELRSRVEAIRQRALACKVLPRPAGDRLVLAQGNTGVTQELPSDPRAFVLGLVQASSSKRKDELIGYVAALADKEGL